MEMIKNLEITFAEMDAEVLAKQTKWALGRAVAIREFYKTEEYQALRKDQWKLYDRLFQIAGGKTWYNIFNGRNDEMISEVVAKNCEAIAEKRNATIVAKLAKNGITEIGELEFNRTDDGFNGVFVFNGARVEIRTIIAGGYNIQCLHQRTLVYVNGKVAR